MHRTILVAATPDDAGHDALALAVELARPSGSGVILAGVVVAHGGPAPGEGHGADALLARLYELRDGAPADVPVTAEVVTSGSLLRSLRDLAERHEAGLLVLGPSHRGAVERMLRGDLAVGAVHSAPCAVAVAVRGQAAERPRRIAVAWDATPEAGEALEWAVQLGERSGAAVQVIRVLEPGHAEGTHPEPAAEEELEAVRRACEQRVTAEKRVAWGDPGAVLTEAGHGFDLMVLGSRARGPLRRALLGSVSAAVLRGAHCPVVVVPEGVHVPADTAAA